MKLNDFQSLSLLSRFRSPVVSSFLVRKEEEIEPLVSRYELHEGVVQLEEETEIVCLTREKLMQVLKDAFYSNKGQSILVRAPLKIEQELYLAVALDQKAKEHVVLAARGRKRAPEEHGRAPYLDMHREVIHANQQLYTFQKTGLFHALRLPESLRHQYFQIIDRMVHLYFATDALLVEANPLAISYPMKMVISHASIQIDDCALYRQSEMRSLAEQNEGRTKEAEWKRKGISYGSFSGDIGVMTMGRELLQALLHTIRQRKGTVGSFVTLDEEADDEALAIGLQVLLEEKNVKVVLVNMFQDLAGKRNRAKILVALLQSLPQKKVPIVLRMEAVHMSEIKEMLSRLEWPVHLVQTLKEAVSLTLALLK